MIAGGNMTRKKRIEMSVRALSDLYAESTVSFELRIKRLERVIANQVSTFEKEKEQAEQQGDSGKDNWDKPLPQFPSSIPNELCPLQGGLISYRQHYMLTLLAEKKLLQVFRE